MLVMTLSQRVKKMEPMTFEDYLERLRCTQVDFEQIARWKWELENDFKKLRSTLDKLDFMRVGCFVEVHCLETMFDVWVRKSHDPNDEILVSGSAATLYDAVEEAFQEFLKLEKENET